MLLDEWCHCCTDSFLMDPSQPMLGWFGQWFWVGVHLHSAAAHHLWQQQKCVVQMNYPECYNLSPEIVLSRL